MAVFHTRNSDDMEENEASEFANMKATVNSETDREKGRTPKEMSRPTASSRAGFVEAQGCAVQIVMSELEDDRQDQSFVP